MSDLPDDVLSSPELTPEEVEEAFKSAEEIAREAQKQFSQAAQHLGYTREVLEAAGPFYVHLAHLAQDQPQLRPLIASGVNYAKSVGNEIKQSTNESASVLRGLYNTAGTAEYFISGANTTASIVSPDYEQYLSSDTPPYFKPTESDVVQTLAAVDPSLADTYKAIGEVYHGTQGDPGRAAIGLMRQTFDHLVDKLAPKDDVRASPFWSKKKGPDVDLVTRKERITYAAHTRIRDKSRVETMLAGTDNILEAYQILNKLHTRGTLSDKHIKSALKTLKKFIEAWAEALKP